jgi:hypothetical protein
MAFPADNIQVIIAGSHFFTRLGIKTLLSVIGIQSDYTELNSLEEVESSFEPGLRSFLIIEQKLCGTTSGLLVLEQISGKCPGCKILVIGDAELKNCPCSHCVFDNDSQQEILEKFQDFFSEKEKPPPKSNGQNMLSDRETGVLKEVARGFSNKEFASKISVYLTLFKNFVLKGEAGNPAELYRVHFGLLRHAYLATMGFFTCGDEIITWFPVNFILAGQYCLSVPAISKPLKPSSELTVNLPSVLNLTIIVLSSTRNDSASGPSETTFIP